MDHKTQRELKQQDQFHTITGQGISWATENRQSAITAGVAVLAVILAIVGASIWYGHRSTAASSALGEAMQVYQTPVATPGQQLPPGTRTFSSVAERAKAANGRFVDVASHYGLLKPGKVARYFAGLTYMEQGENKSAEDSLKSVADSWDGELAALGKLALAQLYRGTSRQDEAVKLYQDLAKGNATTVSPGIAQIQLAEMYESQGKAEEARKIYAQLKDKDKDAKGKAGPIGALAAQKLNPAANPGPEQE